MKSPGAAARRGLPPQELARRAAHLALEKKASDPVLLDLREFDFVCDWYVVMSGDSGPQVKAIATRIEEGLRESGEEPWHVEGLSERQWVLLDYVDVVIHIFQAQVRETYLLERLWGDAPRETIHADPDGS